MLEFSLQAVGEGLIVVKKIHSLKAELQRTFDRAPYRDYDSNGFQ